MALNRVKKLIHNRDFKAIIGTIIGSTVEAMGVVWILEYGNFFATGITGIAQVINKLFLLINENLIISVGILYFVLNVPLLIIGFIGVSKRFSIFTSISVILQSVLILVFEIVRDKTGFSPFASFGEDRLLLAIIGGLIGGLSSGIMLRSGGSAGGVEIISQYLHFKKKSNFALVSLVINATILIAGFFLEDIACVAYTSIRLIIYVVVMDKINTIYKYIKISIVTTKPDEIRNILVNRFNHGITIYKVTGGYSLTEKTELEIIASSYEVEEYRKIAHDIDPNAFMTFTTINRVDGRFNHNRIA
ncbi:MAG: YitT family protein [Bacilli bacterium]|nr:YitT family protein [Bacilli bacterium]